MLKDGGSQFEDPSQWDFSVRADLRRRLDILFLGNFGHFVVWSTSSPQMLNASKEAFGCTV